MTVNQRARLIERRKAYHVTLLAIAKVAGVAESTVCRWEAADPATVAAFKWTAYKNAIAYCIENSRF